MKNDYPKIFNCILESSSIKVIRGAILIDIVDKDNDEYLNKLLPHISDMNMGFFFDKSCRKSLLKCMKIIFENTKDKELLKIDHENLINELIITQNHIVLDYLCKEYYFKNSKNWEKLSFDHKQYIFNVNSPIDISIMVLDEL